ncbi:RCC1 domain-containing protein [Pedosphaera parvula]|uniref:Regulator of chromosome condensation RCC1 n=1 Tax=Pedosphaera parvula (strain Ellin514) TaxID=320771 RepID=B9XLX2_PEDPL|nr:hypothetical protein [Pedosphaera parvula]EEF59100.1 hypothetical protein Cflav_PD1592 [Pedosphaera parvula Ellin514]
MKKPALIIGILFFLLAGWTLYKIFYGSPLPQVTKAMIPPPVVVTLTSSNAPLRIFPGAGNTTFLLPDNSLWRWGMSHGQGIRLLVPTLVETNSSWRQILTANSRTVALHTDGTLWEWGWRGGPRYVTTPQQVDTNHDWVSVTAGDLHSVALKRNGTLWAWGDNSLGQLGPSASQYQTNLIQLGTNRDWMAIGGRGQIIFALREDHTLWIWGQVPNASAGQFAALPALLPFSSDTNWIANNAGNLSHIRNNKGEIYSPSSAASNPTMPAAQFGQQIATNIFTDQFAMVVTDKPKCFALHTDGTLWEMNIRYRPGVLEPTHKWSRVGTRSDWVSLCDASGAAIAMTSDGTVWMWGADLGQEPVPDTRSRIQLLKNRFLSFIGSPPLGSTTSAYYPVQREPRPLLRLVYSNTNQVADKK